MKTFVRLNKNEMKMIMGGTIEDESIDGGGSDRKCKYGSTTYNCSGSLLGCLDKCIEDYGTACEGCTGT
jgi:hypothetical protein